jgi:uncharacterized membrane protein (DUF106 family)
MLALIASIIRFLPAVTVLVNMLEKKVAANEGSSKQDKIAEVNDAFKAADESGDPVALSRLINGG